MQSSLSDRETFAAPDDGVASKACDPESCGDEVAQRQQPEVRQHLVVAQNFGADGHGQRESQKETQSEKPKADRAQAACDHIDESQRESMGKEQARIAAGSRVAHGAQPAELMVAEAAPV